MINFALFLGSCALIGGFAWYFCYLGQSALTAWIAILCLLANLFVLKQIELIHLNATASDIFAIGNLLALNLLQEKYGRKASQQAIWTSFACLLFFVVVSQIHLMYEPSQYDYTQEAYQTLFKPAPRILLASLVTFFIVDQLDSRLYHYFRVQFPKISLLWISALTIGISQLFDTVLFSFFGLYSIVSALFEIIIFSYLIKLLAIVGTLPWSFLSQQLFFKKSC